MSDGSVESRSSAECRPRRESDARVRLRTHAWALVVWAAMAAWSGVALRGRARPYANFRVGRFDLGNMVQAVWSTAQRAPARGHATASTGEQMSRARRGTSIRSSLCSRRCGWSGRRRSTLALAQIVVVALGALPVFWLGRRHLGSERHAALLALAYLAYPWVATSATDGDSIP